MTKASADFSLTSMPDHISTEDLLLRLVSRGLVPCDHNIELWQHADGSGWGAGVTTVRGVYDVEGHGKDLREALEALMVATNRGADLQKP